MGYIPQFCFQYVPALYVAIDLHQYMSKRTQSKNLELGTRKVSNMNFSKVVTLPKTFTENYLGENMEVKMSLSTDGKLTLVPVKQGKGGEKK